MLHLLDTVRCCYKTGWIRKTEIHTYNYDPLAPSGRVQIAVLRCYPDRYAFVPRYPILVTSVPYEDI